MHKVATVVTLAIGLFLVGIAPALAKVDPIPGDTGAGISVSSVSVRGGSGGGSTGGRPCTYQRANVPGDPTTELTITPQMTMDAPRGVKDGTWYFYQCQDPQAPLGVRSGVVFVPTGQPAVPPAVLAQRAARFVAAPAPSIELNPPAGSDHLVNLESWLWVDPSTWGQRSATASVPNESATVVATPVSVTWTMGDGAKVTCRGPGVPYNPNRPPEGQRTNCSHTYERSSAGQPGQRYAVSATTTWSLNWTASGVVTASGALPPLLRTSTTTLRVAEAQAIN